MQRIAIMVCGEVTCKCTGNGCFKAFNEKKDAFSTYEDVQMVAFTHCEQCNGLDDGFEKKIQKLKAARIDTLHLSTCIRGRCPKYELMADIFSEHFNIVGYTHGSTDGKKNNTVNIVKKSFNE